MRSAISCLAALALSACGKVQVTTDAAGEEPDEVDATAGGNGNGGGDADPPTDCDRAEDCTSPGAGRCDLENNTCVACELDEHCAHFGEGYLCEVGTCQQCRFAEVSAGERHTCAVRDSGSAWCRGEGSYGELGDGLAAEDPVTRPVHVQADVRFHAIATGPQGAVVEAPAWTCGLSDDGGILCWGSSDSGRLGNGDDSGDLVLEPTPIGDERSGKSSPWERITPVHCATTRPCGAGVATSTGSWGRGIRVGGLRSRPSSTRCQIGSLFVRVRTQPAESVREIRCGAGGVIAARSLASETGLMAA
jgi:hypothetical protein